MTFITNALKLFGIVYLRFRPIPRIWCVWLVAVNAACLFFITQIEGQVVLAVTASAVVAQTIIFQELGFVRIMGMVHVAWIPMFTWMATRLETIMQDPQLMIWLATLLATNVVCFVVDLIDAYRFVKGERAPHYTWELA